MKSLYQNAVSKTKGLYKEAAKKSKDYYNHGMNAIQGRNPDHDEDDFAQVGMPKGVPHSVEIAGKILNIEKLLDEGGFSFVLSASDQQTGKSYAIKRIFVTEPELEMQMMKEIKVMKSLNHPNVIRFFGHKITREMGKKTLYILMEKAKSGVIEMMRDCAQRRSRFSEKVVLSIFHDICKGLEAMHRQNPSIQHRDLKLENVLKCSGNAFKLCDFGSSTTRVYQLSSRKERSEAQDDIEKNTTLAYRSPEMCDLYGEFPITEKSDMWAMGCILYKLCFFKSPFEDAAAEGSFLPIINCKYDIPSKPKYSDDVIQLIKEMLELDVDKRLDIWEVLDKVAQLRGVENDISRPSHKEGGRLKKVTSERKNRSIKPKEKPKDFFDMLDDNPKDLKQPQGVPQLKKSVTQPKKPAKPMKDSDFDACFEEESAWDAQFSDDDGFDDQPVKPVPLGGRQQAPKSSSGDLFDQLDWVSQSPSQGTSKKHSQSPVRTFTPNSRTTTPNSRTATPNSRTTTPFDQSVRTFTPLDQIMNQPSTPSRKGTPLSTISSPGSRTSTPFEQFPQHTRAPSAFSTGSDIFDDLDWSTGPTSSPTMTPSTIVPQKHPHGHQRSKSYSPSVSNVPNPFAQTSMSMNSSVSSQISTQGSTQAVHGSTISSHQSMHGSVHSQSSDPFGDFFGNTSPAKEVRQQKAQKIIEAFNSMEHPHQRSMSLDSQFRTLPPFAPQSSGRQTLSPLSSKSSHSNFDF